MYIKIKDYKKTDKPKIQLSVQRVEASVWFEMGFAKHHYLTQELNKSAKCFLFYWGDRIVGFCGVLNTPRKGGSNHCAISRLVVLPDFQGLGLGTKIANFIGGIFKNEGYELFIVTANPALGVYFDNSDKWMGTSRNHKGRKNTDDGSYKSRLSRVSYSHKYIGNPIDGYSYMMKPIGEMRKEKEKKEQ